jgi:hypothetical protein
MRANDCDLVTTATKLLVQEARLENGAVCVRNAGEIAEDGDAKGPAVPRSERGKGGRAQAVSGRETSVRRYRVPGRPAPFRARVLGT